MKGAPRTLLQGIQWAAETITNTGYGADNRWNHPVMALFVIITPFIGQFLVFLVFPVVVLPYFEKQFEVRLQHVLPPMNGKVLFLPLWASHRIAAGRVQQPTDTLCDF